MLVTYSGNAQQLVSAEWQQGVPVDGRANILKLSESGFLKFQHEGQIHAQVYPVTVTGLLPPFEAAKRFFDDKDRNPFKEILRRVACHTSNLFGKTVLGMTNRFPRANEFFVKFKQAAPVIGAGLFQKWTKASNAERACLK